MLRFSKNEVMLVHLAKTATFIFSFILTFSVIEASAQSETISIKQGNEPQRLESPAEVSKLKEWKRFNLSEGSLSIFFPDKPGRHTSSGSLPQGFANQYRYFWDTSDEQLYFEAQILEISPDVSFNLERGIQGFKQQQKNRKASLLSEKKIQANGISAFDLFYQVPDEPEPPFLLYSRTMLCSNQVYTLMVAGAKNQKDLPEVAGKYFDSFSPTVECEAQRTAPVETNPELIERRTATPSKRYIRGRRGGCYYISSRGSKVYVDRSLCR